MATNSTMHSYQITLIVFNQLFTINILCFYNDNSSQIQKALLLDLPIFH